MTTDPENKFAQGQSPSPYEIAAAHVIATAEKEGIPIGQAFVAHAARGLDGVRGQLLAHGFELPAVALLVLQSEGKVSINERDVVDEGRQFTAVVGEPGYGERLADILRTGLRHALGVEQEACEFSHHDAAELYERQDENRG